MKKLGQRIKSFFSREIKIALVLFCLALLFRLVYIDFGFPVQNLINDEYYGHSFMTAVASGVNPFMQVINPYPAGSLFFAMPFLGTAAVYAVIDSGTFDTGALSRYVLVDSPGIFILASRVASAVAGALTVIMAFYICRRILKNETTALIVAALAAVSVNSVSMSHWGGPHTIMNFFRIAAVLSAIIFDQDKKPKFLLWSGIFAAASGGTHLLGFLSVFAPLLAWFRNRSVIPFKKLFFYVVLCVLVVLVLYGFNAPGTIKMIRDSFASFNQSSSFVEDPAPSGVFRLLFPFTDIWALEPSAAVLGVIALILIAVAKFRRLDRYIFLLVGIGFTYLGLVSVAAMPHVSRWLLPWTLFITLTSAIIILDRVGQLKIPIRFTLYATVMLALIWSGSQTGRWLGLLKSTPYEEAREWVVSRGEETKIFGTELDFNLPLNQKTAATLIERYSASRNTPRKLFYYYAKESNAEGPYFSYEFNQYQTAETILCGDENLPGYDYIIYPYETEEKRLRLFSCILDKFPKATIASIFGYNKDGLYALREFANPTSWRLWWDVDFFGEGIVAASLR